jgi:LPXTG-motif cell wall-anchored protein
VRIRFALALMVAGLLFAAGIASAQTTTDQTSPYTTSTPTATQPKTTTSEGTQTTAVTPTTEAQTQSNVAPSVAAQPAGTAPSTLAFTGAEPLLLILVGLALAGGTATLLVRDRRKSSDQR